MLGIKKKKHFSIELMLIFLVLIFFIIKWNKNIFFKNKIIKLNEVYELGHRFDELT
jgi:hypothetical protein